MSKPIVPSEPSTIATSQDPNSITNISKMTGEIENQAEADKKYDTKGKLYSGFQDGPPSMNKIVSIGTSFLLAAGFLMVVGALLPKGRKRF